MKLEKFNEAKEIHDDIRAMKKEREFYIDALSAVKAPSPLFTDLKFIIEFGGTKGGGRTLQPNNAHDKAVLIAFLMAEIKYWENKIKEGVIHFENL